MSEHPGKTMSGYITDDPPCARILFRDIRRSVVWFIIRDLPDSRRLGIGLDSPGAVLKRYWTGAATVSATGNTPIAFDRYRCFVPKFLDTSAYVWFAKRIVTGETLVRVSQD